jgi:hypothetical protein
LKRRVWISSIAVIVVIVSILVVLYVNNNPSSPQGTNMLSDFDTLSIGPHYLSRPPYFPDNSDKITKFFLESAALKYDYSNASFTSDSGYEDYTGVPAVVVNATVRNDYTVEEIIQFSEVGFSESVFGIDVYMYDNAGNFVGTLHRGDPFRGYVLSMKSGETVSVNMIFATPNRNIDHFEIYISYFL